MISTIIYFVLVLCFLVYCIIKQKGVLSYLLLGYYTFIAFMAVWTGYKGINDSTQATLLPYLLMVFSYFLYFFPFTQNKAILNPSKIDTYYLGQYSFFSYFFIFCSIIYCKVYWLPVINTLKSGEWSEVRLSLYSGTLIAPYNNRFEYLCLLIVSYFGLLALIVGFSIIRDGERTVLGFILIIADVIPNVMQALYTASRGSIFDLGLLLLILYLFILQDIRGGRKNIIFIALLLSIVFLMPIMLQITSSRFSSSNAQNSILQYYGESPIYFNTGVANINRYALGKYFFSGLFDTEFSQQALGGRGWGTHFFTFIGYTYIDWGFVGTILIGVFCLCIFYTLVIKESYSIADLFLLFFYYETLLKGALTIGSRYIYTIISSIVIYIVCKFVIEKTRYRRMTFLFNGHPIGFKKIYEQEENNSISNHI